MLISKVCTSVINKKQINKQTTTYRSLLYPHPAKTYNSKDLASAFKAYNYNVSFYGSLKINPYCDELMNDFLKNHSNINAEDACTCLSLNFSEDKIAKYQELKINYPSLNKMELGLIALAGLSDNEIQRYLQITSDINSEGNKKYDVANEEIILCIKEGFNDSQILRYSELRNKKFDLRDESVRGTGGKQKYPINYVIDAIKESKTDEEIEEEENFHKTLKKYGLENGILTWLYGFEFNVSDYIKECRDKVKNGEINYIVSLIGAGQYLHDSNIEIPQKSQEEHSDKCYETFLNFFKEINKIVETPFASQCIDILKLGKSGNLSFENAMISMFLPPDLQNEVLNGNISTKEIIVSFLPDKIKRFYLEGHDNIFYKTKKDMCEVYATERLIADYTQQINPILSTNEDDLYLSEQELDTAFKLIEQGCNAEQARILAKAGISSVIPEILEQIPENVWYLMQTGANKETHDIIQKAIKLILGFSESEPQLTDIKAGEIDDVLLDKDFYDGKKLEHIEDNPDNNFSLNIQKLMIQDKPVLVLMDNNSDDSFVALNGAIAYVAPPHEIDEEKIEENMESHCNLSKEKQLPILKIAIKEFVFDITDENGSCIISKGIENVAESFVGSEKTDDEIKTYYLDALKKLKQDDKLNAQNILRLFPEDTVLSINPYTTKNNGNMLYSISGEWKSKDGTKWQIRIHSTDLSINGSNSDWDTRLGYELINTMPNQQKTFYLRYDKDNDTFDFNGTYKGKDSHIKIDSPVGQNNLLNNTDFQKMVRNISSKLYETKKVSRICEKYHLPVQIGYRNVYEQINAVINDAMQNPVHYFEQKNNIDSYRRSLGLLDLNCLKT